MSKNVLLTGGSGFLGSNIALELLRLGHNVSLLLRPNSSLGRLGSYSSDFNIGRTSTFRDIKNFVANVRPNVIIHTSCCYGRNGESPLEVTDANYRFGLELIQAVALTNRSVSFINTGTSLEQQISLYSLTKRQFSDLGHVLATAPASKLRFINVQLEHMYGPGDDEKKFTANVIRACSCNHAELNLTAGTQKRDFIYIDDVVSAYTTILDKVGTLASWENIEVGSGDARPLREFVEKIHNLTGSSTKLKFGAIPFRQYEQMHSQANIAQMQSLGWKPKFNQEAGIKKIIEK